ncbi:MAG TPA: hypothetical protein VMV93_12910 [Chloroflexota bacterium]|nr:hypothetical protein [Chloroflexota bacterium]
MNPRPAQADAPDYDIVATRAFNVSLLFSATRCTLMYVVLPILLPWLGIVGKIPVPVLMACDLLALSGIVFSLRRLWRLQSPRRWQYLPLACGSVFVMATFLISDVLTAAH